MTLPDPNRLDRLEARIEQAEKALLVLGVKITVGGAQDAEKDD